MVHIKDKNSLMAFETVCLLVGFVVELGILSLPNILCPIAKQDAWISVLIGGLYPLYMACIGIFLCSNSPNKNILELSKRYFGKVVGTFFNVIFMLQFFTYCVITVVGMSNVCKVYITPFLDSKKLFIPIVGITIYVARYGIKLLARVSKITFVLTAILLLILTNAFARGNIYNVMPVLTTNVKNVLFASIYADYSYGGLEAILIIYIFIEKKEKIKKIGLGAAFALIFLFTSAVFISIYYIGYKVNMKSMWPILLATESINLPMINSFRYIFLLFWNIVVLRLIASLFWIVKYIAVDSFKIKREYIIDILEFFIAIYIAFKIGNEMNRRELIETIIPLITLFNIFYSSTVSLMVFIDKIKNKRGMVKQ